MCKMCSLIVDYLKDLDYFFIIGDIIIVIILLCLVRILIVVK